MALAGQSSWFSYNVLRKIPIAGRLERLQVALGETHPRAERNTTLTPWDEKMQSRMSLQTWVQEQYRSMRFIYECGLTNRFGFGRA
jgi:hypothetical protein